MTNSFMLFILLAMCCGCGVKGDPLPPERPVPIGRGEPTYQRAIDDLGFSKLPPIGEEDEESEQKEDDINEQIWIEE